MEEMIYAYLVNNCVGYDNRVKARVLMNKFGINDNKTFRSYIQSIREDYQYPRLIGSEAGKYGGYWIINSKQEFDETVHHLYARAIEMQKNCKIMKKKWKEGFKNGK